MAHPPATQSDLTLRKFLEMSIKSGKGLKLDFKSLDAVENGLEILDSFNNIEKVIIKIFF